MAKLTGVVAICTSYIPYVLQKICTRSFKSSKQSRKKKPTAYKTKDTNGGNEGLEWENGRDEEVVDETDRIILESEEDYCECIHNLFVHLLVSFIIFE